MSWRLSLLQWITPRWGYLGLKGHSRPKQSQSQIQLEVLKGRKMKLWSGVVDVLPHTGWSIMKLLSEASNCRLVADTTSGLCKMKPDTSENSLSDREMEHAYFINHFPCSISNTNVTAMGRKASIQTNPKAAAEQEGGQPFPSDNPHGNRSSTSRHYSLMYSTVGVKTLPTSTIFISSWHHA